MAWKIAIWVLKTGIDINIILFAFYKLTEPEIILLVLIIRLIGMRFFEMTRGIWWFCEKVSEENDESYGKPLRHDTDSLNNRLGGVIRKYRSRVVLKQSELAEELTKRLNGEIVVSREDISMYELGLKLPPAHILEELADLYGITMDTLFGRK